jgi:Protein kinase domain
MSPEQARGKPVDHRADIWAFACVLYEMLTGKPPFGGEGVTDTLGAVLHTEPDWDRLDPAIPARIRMVLQRCLRKDPRQRLHAIADVSLVLGGAFETPAPSSGADSRQPVSPARSRGTHALAAVAGLAIGGLIAGAVMWTWRAAPASTAPVRVVLTTPADPALRHGVGPDLAITPDGTRVIYQVAAAGGGLASRALNQLQPTILQGTSASEQPFVSPDGAWVGYRDQKDGAIKKISIDGGPAITLTPPQFGLQGASWGYGVIVFASARSGGLFRVPDTGGEPEQVTSADEKRGEVGHAWPHLLPGSQAVLFTREIRNQETRRSETVLLDLRTREQRVLIPEGSGATYVATGHLVYAVGSTLRAVGFDLATRNVRGKPVPVLDGVVSNAQGAPNFSVSSTGSLVYVMSPATTWTGRPVWVSHDGREESTRITDDVIAPQFPRLWQTRGARAGRADRGAGRIQRRVALARWPVARAHVRSVRSDRSVGPAVSGSWCAGPGVNERRHRACLVQDRPRAVLPGGATGHGGRCEHWLDVRVQAADVALRQPLPDLRSTVVVRCRGRWAVSDDQTDHRSADLAAGGGRPQLA